MEAKKELEIIKFNSKQIISWILLLENNKLLIRYITDEYGLTCYYLFMDNDDDIEIYTNLYGDIFTAYNTNFILDNLINNLESGLQSNNIYIKEEQIDDIEQYKNDIQNYDLESEIGFIRYKNRTWKIIVKDKNIDYITIPEYKHNFTEIIPLQHTTLTLFSTENFDGDIGSIMSKDGNIGYVYSKCNGEITIAYIKQ